MKSLKKGFTLIELLVVIAIIAILATVIIINVTGARAKAARAKVAGDVGTAVKEYVACQAFGGTAAMGTAAGTICTMGTAITEPAEVAAAGGSWPTLPTGFAYATPAGTDVVSITATPTTMTLKCSPSGCVAAGNW